MNRRDSIKKAALLLGGVISAPTLLALKSCKNREASISDAFALSDVHRKIVSEIAELILPKTDTPGAIDAGVPAFIEMMILDCYKKPEQTSFMEGVQALAAEDFTGMSSEEKTARLQKLEADAKEEMKARDVKQTKIGDNIDEETMKAQAKGLPFWRLMKELTLLGYFTSEAGIRSSFEYVQIPTKFEPIKIEAGQKAYAY